MSCERLVRRAVRIEDILAELTAAAVDAGASGNVGGPRARRPPRTAQRGDIGCRPGGCGGEGGHRVGVIVSE
jgi:hypothetical protein